LRALGLMIKPVSGSCQLRCRYCFYENVTESRAIRNYGAMSLATLETLVSRAISETDEELSFFFQGGEPTLAGPDFYRALIDLQKRYKRELGKDRLVVRYALQTNGIALDDEWCVFLAKHHFLVGLSLDGDKAVHDANRVDAAGRGTYDRVRKAARLLDRHGVEYNLLCVVTREMARHGRRIYRELVREGFRYLQFIPCIEDFGAAPGASPHALTVERYGRFLCDLFDEWYRDLQEGRYTSVRHFDNWVHMLQGLPPETCSMSGQCVCYGVVEADGGVYPCDFYVLDEWRLGSVLESSFAELLSGETARRFVEASKPIAARCRDCRHLALCRGGCRRDREPLADPTEGSLNRYCEAYLAFFDDADDRLRDVARRTAQGGHRGSNG